MIEERAFRGGQYAAEIESADVYRARRARVQERLEKGAVALLMGATDARGYGDVGTFRQDPSFFYLTGVELPSAALLIEKEHEALLLPARRPSYRGLDRAEVRTGRGRGGRSASSRCWIVTTARWSWTPGGGRSRRSPTGSLTF